MGKLTFSPRTLDDEVVKDGLSAVSTLDHDSRMKDIYFVVGGVATQSYLPTSCRRSTSDIDLALLRPLNYSDFKSLSSNLSTFLADQGYTVTQDKNRFTYMIIYSKNNQAGVIEFPARSPANYSRWQTLLEEEHKNTRRKLVEGRNPEFTYTVAGTEDIAAPKLMRSLHALRDRPNLANDIAHGIPQSLSEEQIAQRLREINDFREVASKDPNYFALAKRLRFISDLYDVRILSEIPGFNERQLRHSLGLWNVLKIPSSQRNAVFSYSLPRVNLDNLSD